VFGVNSTNGAVNRICQASPGNSLQWSSWEDVGARVKPGLVVGQSGNGRLEIWAVNAEDSVLLHRWETQMDGSDHWSEWAGAVQQAATYPAVGENEDGNLEVFAADPNDEQTINHRRQISSASGWLDWSSLDRRTFEYSSRLWQVDEGLPDNLVQALAQTRDGYLWVGTRDGLARFDGVAFTRYDARNTPTLRNSSITALCTDRHGALWIGTDGGGLLRVDGGNETAKRRNGETAIHRFALSPSHRFNSTNGLAGDHVRVICEGRDGSLWIGTTTGMRRVSRFQAKPG